MKSPKNNADRDDQGNAGMLAHDTDWQTYQVSVDMISQWLVEQKIPDTASAQELLALYGNFASINAGDFVTRKATSNGQVITAISSSPLTDDSESNVVLDVPVKQPAALEIEASMSQRIRHDFATVCLFANDTDGSDPTPDDIQINTIYQSSAVDGAAYNAVAGTTLTIVLNAPFMGYLTDWFHVFGLVDNRFNYPNLAINYISFDRKTICASFSDEVALPSLAATISPGAGTAFIRHYNNMGGAKEWFGMRFTGNSATSAALVSVFGGNDVQISGTPLGDHRVTVGTTNPIYASGKAGQVEIRATSRYRLEGRPGECSWHDKTSDLFGPFVPRDKPRTSVKPAIQSELRARFRMYSPKSMTRPVAKWVTLVRTSNVVVVTTAAPHNVVTGTYVNYKGARDVTNFANTTTPMQATYISPTSYSVPWTGTNGTTYGGATILVNGGVDQQGLLWQTIQTAQVIAATGASPDQLILTGNTNWSTGVGVMNVGDYMDIYGVRNATNGGDLGVDGAWEVANISTTQIVLIPIVDILGNRISPVVTTLVSTNCGWIVLHRTTLRAHDILVEGWKESKVIVDGQWTTRLDKAVPVRLIASDVTQPTTSAGAVAVDGVMTNPVAIGGRASNANISAMSATWDLVAQLMTMIGVSITKQFSLPEADWTATPVTITNVTSTAFRAAAGAGIKNFCTSIELQNTNAVATSVNILAGATIKKTYSLPASMTLPLVIDYSIPLQTAANEAFNIQAATTGANVIINAQGYVAP